VYTFFKLSISSLVNISYFPLSVCSYTFLKNIGLIIPFIPLDKTTLLDEREKLIPFFKAKSKSISMKISQVFLIPLITSLSYGYPTAKWIWFRDILFKPDFMMNYQESLKVPWMMGLFWNSFGSRGITSLSSYIVGIEWP